MTAASLFAATAAAAAAAATAVAAADERLAASAVLAGLSHMCAAIAEGLQLAQALLELACEPANVTSDLEAEPAEMQQTGHVCH